MSADKLDEMRDGGLLTAHEATALKIAYVSRSFRAHAIARALDEAVAEERRALREWATAVGRQHLLFEWLAAREAKPQEGGVK